MQPLLVLEGVPFRGPSRRRPTMPPTKTPPMTPASRSRRMPPPSPTAGAGRAVERRRPTRPSPRSPRRARSRRAVEDRRRADGRREPSPGLRRDEVFDDEAPDPRRPRPTRSRPPTRAGRGGEPRSVLRGLPADVAPAADEAARRRRGAEDEAEAEAPSPRRRIARAPRADRGDRGRQEHRARRVRTTGLPDPVVRRDRARASTASRVRAAVVERFGPERARSRRRGLASGAGRARLRTTSRAAGSSACCTRSWPGAGRWRAEQGCPSEGAAVHEVPLLTRRAWRPLRRRRADHRAGRRAARALPSASTSARRRSCPRHRRSRGPSTSTSTTERPASSTLGRRPRRPPARGMRRAALPHRRAALVAAASTGSSAQGPEFLSAPSTRSATPRSSAATPAPTASTRRCSRPSSTRFRTSSRTCASRVAPSASCSCCRARPRALRRARAGRSSSPPTSTTPLSTCATAPGTCATCASTTRGAGLDGAGARGLQRGHGERRRLVQRTRGGPGAADTREFAETSAYVTRIEHAARRLPPPLRRDSGSSGARNRVIYMPGWGVFQLSEGYEPTGDQPQAIASSGGRRRGMQYQTLLGVTGSGKTFTMANVIAAVQRPTLVLAHNKTLAAQLYRSSASSSRKRRRVLRHLLRLLPARGVHPATRHVHREGLARSTTRSTSCATSATQALLERRDVIIVARCRASTASARPRVPGA